MWFIKNATLSPTTFHVAIKLQFFVFSQPTGETKQVFCVLQSLYISVIISKIVSIKNSQDSLIFFSWEKKTIAKIPGFSGFLKMYPCVETVVSKFCCVCYLDFTRIWRFRWVLIAESSSFNLNIFITRNFWS